MARSRSAVLICLFTLAVAVPLQVRAQGATASHDSTKSPSTKVISDTTKAPPPKVITPQLNFSGVIFGNFQLHTDDATKAANGGKTTNRFDIERVYLNFLMPVGDRASIRATSDIFQNASSNYYSGWDVRLKYAWLQYDYLKGATPNSASAFARLGMLTTVLIDYEESFWPRYLSTTGPDRNGFFSSADMGAATQVNLPNSLGQVYATVTNGNGYQSPETDRFKDYALRLSLTPFGRTTGLMKTFSVSPWGYFGRKGSSFAAGGPGQVGPVSDGLDRNRWGVFAGLKDRRLTAGAEYAEKIDQTEAGDNTLASPRTVSKTTAQLADGFVIARPAEWAHPEVKSPFGVVLRWDRFKPNKKLSAWNQFVIAGLFWDLTPKATLALDYQAQTPKAGSTTPASKVWYLHWVANF